MGEDRGTYVGVGLGIAAALAVAVASRIGGLVTGPNGAAIGVGADVGATKVDVSDGLLHAEMMAITVKIIGMTLVFRFTLCSLRVALDAV